MPRKRPGKKAARRAAPTARLWAIITYVSDSPQGPGFYLDGFVRGNQDDAGFEARAAHESRPRSSAYSQSFPAVVECGVSCVDARPARPADVWLLRRNVAGAMEYRVHARASGLASAEPFAPTHTPEWEPIRIAEAWVPPAQLAAANNKSPRV